MPSFKELTWEEAMRRGHAALLDSEHLRRAEVKAAQAQVWLALARELGSQGDRDGIQAPERASEAAGYR
jgi:hypothetical protein